MWSGLFDAPGGLGGAIWGYVDETFMLPEPKVGTAFWKEFARTAKPEDYQGKCVGYGEWGIVDVCAVQTGVLGYQESLFARPPDDDRGGFLPVRTTFVASVVQPLRPY